MLWILEHIDRLDPEAVLRFLPTISEARRARVLSMTHVPSRVRSVLAELLLRRALREEYGLTDLPRLDTGEKGKPFFPDRPDLQFSLSHCRTAAACALAHAPVGVDVQEVRHLKAFPLRGRWHRASPASPMTDEVVPQARETPPVYRILSEQERAWVEAGETPAERDRRFTAVWTCKEAYGKALGVGFLYDLRSTCFVPDKETWRQYDTSFLRLSREAYELTLCAASALSIQTLTPSDFMDAAERLRMDGPLTQYEEY